MCSPMPDLDPDEIGAGAPPPCAHYPECRQECAWPACNEPPTTQDLLTASLAHAETIRAGVDHFLAALNDRECPECGWPTEDRRTWIFCTRCDWGWLV